MEIRLGRRMINFSRNCTPAQIIDGLVLRIILASFQIFLELHIFFSTIIADLFFVLQQFLISRYTSYNILNSFCWFLCKTLQISRTLLLVILCKFTPFCWFLCNNLQIFPDADFFIFMTCFHHLLQTFCLPDMLSRGTWYNLDWNLLKVWGFL